MLKMEKNEIEERRSWTLQSRFACRRITSIGLEEGFCDNSIQPPKLACRQVEVKDVRNI